MLLYIVPVPTVMVLEPTYQTVGRRLTLWCEVTALRGITSRVDIVWRSGGTVLERLTDLDSIPENTNTVVYRGSYMLQPLSRNDTGRVFQCEVIIDTSSPIMADDTFTLNVTGKPSHFVCLSYSSNHCSKVAAYTVTYVP